MKWLVGVLAAIVLLAIAAGLALPFLVDLPRVKALIAGSAAQALGRPVKFAAVSLSLLPSPAVELRGLEVAEDPAFGPAPFLKLDTGRLSLRLRPLLGGRVEFREVTLSAPRIALVQRADGRWNVASLGAAPEPRGTARAPRAGGGSGAPGGSAPLPATRVSIQHGVVTYAPSAPGRAGSWRLEDLNLTLADSGGGALAVAGTLRVMPGDLAVTITDGRIGGLNGGHGLLDAPLAARVSLDGRDVAPLVAALAGPAPAIAGPVKGTLTVSGTLGAPRATGSLALATVRLTQRNAACPEPQQRTLALTGLTLTPAWQDGRLTARPVSAGLGGGTIATQVTVTLEGGARVELKDLAIRALPVERVLVDFLCQGYAVAGPLDLTGALAFGAADPWNTLSGPGQLRIGPGRVVGAQALKLMDGVVRVGGAVSALLGADLPVALFTSPLEFEAITGTYQIVNGLVTTKDLLYTSRAMRVAVAGDYGLASGRLNLDMLVHHGRGEVRARVTGTAASPSIRVTQVPATVLRDVDPKKVESGLKDLLERFRR